MDELVGINQRAKEYPIVRDSKGTKRFEHRLVWERIKGKIPEGYVIHHKNGNKKDNRIENLELLSKDSHAKRHSEINNRLAE